MKMVVNSILQSLPAAINVIAVVLLVFLVFACAGVGDGTPNLMAINFLSQRHMIDRLVERGSLPPRGAIAMISSVAGLGWQMEMETSRPP